MNNEQTEAQTPDTDALHAAFMADRSMPSLDAYFDLLALARKLERERAILKTRIDATGKKEDSQ
jgi:hypothetical protein